jgi:hypothetical protein
MNVSRLLYWLLLLTGLVCAVGVVSTGVVLAWRLSRLPRPAPQAQDAEQPSAPSATGGSVAVAQPAPIVDADPRARFAPEPFSADEGPPPAPPRVEGPVASAVTPVTSPPVAVSLPPPLPAPRKLTAIERATGSFFGPTPRDPLARPQMVEVVVPEIPGSTAIWGAIGRDDRGRIWYGVTCEGSNPPSAHLLEMDAATSQSADRGDVVSELTRLGLAKPDDQQTKIHSKIVQAEDGHLYFSSMDEAGELALEGRNPTFGSHLWRLRLADYRWEHLAAVPEGLVAVGTGGRFVYALGYFGHVLYQYDTASGEIRKVRVGSTAGHVSRNFLVDMRGHAYVPRLVAPRADAPTGPPKWVASLVEYDPQLKELGETPLEHYLDPQQHPEQSHGIIGIATLADGSMMFVAQVGYIYHIVPRLAAGRAEVRPVGWIHPSGTSYTASLFSYDGQRWLMGAGRRSGAAYEWAARDLASGQALARELTIIDLFQPPRQDVLLYGSAVRDFQGRFYVAGRYVWRTASRPLLMRVEPPEMK